MQHVRRPTELAKRQVDEQVGMAVLPTATASTTCQAGTQI